MLCDRLREVERILMGSISVEHKVELQFNFLNSEGVNPVVVLKLVFNEDLELNPTVYMTSSIVSFGSLLVLKISFAASILCEFMRSKKLL